MFRLTQGSGFGYDRTIMDVYETGVNVMEGPGSNEVQELQDKVRLVLEELRASIRSDFAAIALYDPEHREIRWRLAFGSLNDRYRAIAIRVGKGIAGDVLQTGRPMLVAAFPADVPKDPMEYPIMVVEQLASCYAVPIGDGGNIFGVLMVAERTTRIYNELERGSLSQASSSLGELYAPLYAKTVIAKEPPSTELSPLEQYFRQQKGKSPMHAEAEILDQSITRIPSSLQVEMTGWLERLSGVLKDALYSESSDCVERTRITIERQEGNRMALEVTAPGRLERPHEQLSWLIKKVGALSGNVEMYNEPGMFRLRLNLPEDLLSDDKPWNFKGVI